MSTPYENAARSRWIAGFLMLAGAVFLLLPGAGPLEREGAVTHLDVQRIESTLDMARREEAGERLTPFEQNRRRNDPASVEELEARLEAARGNTRTSIACREMSSVALLGTGLAVFLVGFVRRQWPDDPEPSAPDA